MAAEQPVSPEWRSSRLNRQEFEQAKASVLDVLRTYGITRLIVGYDGCDDEGGFDLLAYYPFSAISPSEIPATPAMMRLREVRWRAPGAYSIVDAAFDLAFLALEVHFGGWEIDDGAAGAFIIDVVQGTLVLQHSYRDVYHCPELEV